MKAEVEIDVQDIDHLGIIAGIIDEIGIVEIIDEEIGTDVREKVSAGKVVKAMMINCMGFLTAPLYLFSQFFVGKATEHLIGEGAKAEYLNDSRLGRVLDQIYEYGVTFLFIKIACVMAKRFKIKTKSAHIDGTSISVEGKYLQRAIETLEQSSSLEEILEKASSEVEGQKKEEEEDAEPVPITITHGYSRDHRPDLKQYTIENEIVIKNHRNQAGRFILATNLLDEEIDLTADSNTALEQQKWTPDLILKEYKSQQSTERGFRFIKDPLFFVSRVFLKNTKRIMALAMIMTLALMVYSLGQRQLRSALELTSSTLPNQKGKPTARPTLRWILQCFQSVHLVFVNGIKSSIKLTPRQNLILEFLGSSCHQYYFLS